MRPSIILGVIALCLAFSARADDTKPPQISEVRAGAKGGQVQVEARITDETGVLSAICHHRSPGGRVEDSPMVKNDFDDVFRASFPGGPDTEYWIEASDLLGNGPATYGSSAKAVAVGGPAVDDKTVSRREPPPRQPREPRRPRETAAATPPQSPAIEHSRPAAQPPERVAPGQPIVLRAQVVPPSDNGEMPDRVAVLWRGNDGQDQLTDMVRDETGGWGGYKAELPPQEEGAIFFQVVACDPPATRCGIDTGSRRQWHAAAGASQPGSPRPLPLDAAATKAPPIPPEGARPCCFP